MEEVKKVDKENVALPGNDNSSDLKLPGNDKYGRPKKSLDSKRQSQMYFYFERLFRDVTRVTDDYFKSSHDRASEDFQKLSIFSEFSALEAWVDNHLSDLGRNRLLTAIRKSKVRQRNISVNEHTAYHLRWISERVVITNDEILEIALKLFERQQMARYRERKPLKGERLLFDR